MLTIEEAFQSRRDTRHFTDESVPEEVVKKALAAGHMAPSVGLTDATKYYLIYSPEVKQGVKKLFEEYNQKALLQINDENQKKHYSSLKLEAILEAPCGLVIAYDRSVLNTFSIGTIASNETIKFSAVCAAQNIWLSLTAQGYSMGWVSILNYYRFKKLIGLPEEMEPIGYFCIGKPASDYDKQPMLQQLKWASKSKGPSVEEISQLNNMDSDPKPIPEFESGRGSGSESVRREVKNALDNKTKPVQSLGILERLAAQVAEVFENVHPEIKKPHVVVFAADHGIAQHGTSAYPQEVTRQMVENFLAGGAAINVFCRQHVLELTIVDAGVNYDFPSTTALVNKKMGKGTQSFLYGPAMSRMELDECLAKGSEIVRSIANSGCNCIGFGEMGIGNTSAASVLMSLLCKIPLSDCIGKGTGLSDEKMVNKFEILSRALSNYEGDSEVLSIVQYFGGFEILQMAGAMLEAFKNNMLILVDGFISSVAYLIAFKINKEIKSNAVFCHCSAEKGHRLLLNYLQVKEILQLEMRLGEGTGCAVAFPIIQSAVAFLNEMASFESADVSTPK